MSGRKIIKGLKEAVAHAQAAPVEPKENPRVSLGLEAAHAGDPRGLERFLRFIVSEFEMLAIFSDLPDAVKRFPASLSRELRSAADFVSGFEAGRAEQRAAARTKSRARKSARTKELTT